MSITRKLLLLSAAWLAAFLTFATVAYGTLNHVKVNGGIYNSITKGKDLIADVLPPPEYIIESYLVSLQAVHESDPARLAALIARGDELRADYEERHKFWTNTLEEGPIRRAMLETSYPPAAAFFDIRERELIPAIRAGDRERAAAIAYGPMREKYEAHRKGIDEVVRLAAAKNEEHEHTAASAVSTGVNRLLALGVIVLLIGAGIGVLTARIASSLTRKMELASHVAGRVADGDLDVQVEGIHDHDEAGRLLASIHHMAESLNHLVSRVKQSVVELISTMTAFNAARTQQEEVVAGFGASTSEIAAAVSEISATSQELLGTMNEVNGVAEQTSILAEAGRTGIIELDTTMQHLTEATASISSKLAVIRERASEITGVVDTITKVADQTNLLSVNAAIEAEKAGEYGLGFLVVAREIRRLADQTAVATLNIEQMVRQMQGAVGAGVMEMDKFSDEVRRGVQSVNETNTQFGQIIEQVKSLTKRFDGVNEGMHSQSIGAQHINEAMATLTSGARQTAGTLKELSLATDQLRGATEVLTQEISHFKVSDKVG